MCTCTKIASSPAEREAIFRFRYEVYIEELNKQHIKANHSDKLLCDEADASATLYYACNKGKITATVRSQRGNECVFSEEGNALFNIPDFEKSIPHEKIAIVDRLMVKQEYRNSTIAHGLMLASYLGGIESNTKICFILCEEKLLPMYLRYGFRVFNEPVQLLSGEERYCLYLCLCDLTYLQQVKSPFLPYLLHHLDDKGAYAEIVQKRFGAIYSLSR